MTTSHPHIVTVDLRPYFYYGLEPFPRIMRAVANLEPGQGLRLLVPFEPEPLYRVMAGRGFSYTANEVAAGNWEVLFEPGMNATDPAITPGDEVQWMIIDVRGLEPPMPLVRVLEVLETLPVGRGLVVHTDRRPMLLLDELPQRGFTGESQTASDGGGYITLIRRI